VRPMRVVPTLATRLAVVGVLVIGVAGCGGGGPSDLGGVPTTIELPSTTIGAAAGSPEPATPPTLLPDYASLVAKARTSESLISVYDAPDASAARRRLTEPPPVTGGVPFGGPDGLRVESQQADGWVKVQLPVPKQKGSVGWVRDTDVTITQVSYRMRIALRTGRLTVFGRGRQIYQGPIVRAGSALSIPAGHYYLRGFFTAPKSRMTDSAFVYGLIQKLSTLIPLGTPVDIVA
jgi:hypothetical protein